MTNMETDLLITTDEKNLAGGQPAGRRILLVEDDPTLLGLLSRQLEKKGYEVQTARDGLEALVCLDKSSVDIVVTDVIMPRVDGFEMMQEIRRRWPSLKIIAMSGGGYCGAGVYLDLSLRFGAVQVLEKPFTFEALLELLRAKLQEGAEELAPAA
jgi:DNA-binding response OmpR family regulator